MIWNEFYRDQDLQNEVDLEDGTVKNVSWRKDYFTTARPWQQKGGDLTLPLGDKAHVVMPQTTATDISMMKPDGTFWKAPANNTFLQVGGAGGSNGTEGTALYADLAGATGITAADFREFFALQRFQEARARYGSRYTEYLQYLGIKPSDARLQRPEYLGGGKQNLQFSEVLLCDRDWETL